MTIPKPTGPHASEMLEDGAWPEIDEHELNNRADALTETLRKVTSVVMSWQHEQGDLFADTTWSGNAAYAASKKVVTTIKALQEQQRNLAKAVLWYRFAAGTVAGTKVAISLKVEDAEADITAIEATAEFNPDAESQIQSVKDAAHAANLASVSTAAEAVVPAAVPTPEDQIQQVIEQASRPAVNPGVPGSQSQTPNPPGSNVAKPGEPGRSGAVNASPAAVDGKTTATHAPPSSAPPPTVAPNPSAVDGKTTATQAPPVAPAAQPPASPPGPSAVDGKSTAMQAPPGAPPSPAGGSTPSSPSSPGSSLGSPGSLASGGAGGSSSSSGGSSSSTSAASALSSGGGGAHAGGGGQSASGGSAAGGSPSGSGSSQSSSSGGGSSQSGQGAGAGQGVPKAPAPLASPPPAAPAAAAASQVPPPAAATAPATATPGGSSLTATPGAAASVGTGSAAPGVAPATTSGAPAPANTMGGSMGAALGGGAGAPAAPGVPLGPPPTPAPAAPVAAPAAGPAVAPASTTATAGGGVAAGPVPVSAARAEREAVLQAVNAEASRSLRGGSGDAINLAVRIAAALNAADSPDRHAAGFFWATGVTSDGQILVANSYGVGYIPAGLNLPEQARFVSLDDSIPLDQRVSWATNPWRALAGWTQAKGVDLRTVIGAEQHLHNVDVGAAHKKLEPDDIPPTSKMVGRDRLALIAPESAKRLAETTDAALVNLLPPAGADAGAPQDRSADLWFAVMAPMMSQADGRDIAQLQALLAYADHRQELAIHAGHTSPDAAAQRAAIADGLYWHHLATLTDAALNAVQRSAPVST